MFTFEKSSTWQCGVCDTKYTYANETTGGIDFPGLIIIADFVCCDCMDLMPASFIDDFAFGKIPLSQVIPKWRKYRSKHKKDQK